MTTDLKGARGREQTLTEDINQQRLEVESLRSELGETRALLRDAYRALQVSIPADSGILAELRTVLFPDMTLQVLAKKAVLSQQERKGEDVDAWSHSLAKDLSKLP
jgi:hypothetical protein